LQLKQGSVKK